MCLKPLLLEMVEEILPWGPHDVVNLVYLVELVVSREKWEQREDLKEDTSGSPYVHLVAVVSICEQALRGSVPTGRNVFGKRRFAVEAATTAKIS